VSPGKWSGEYDGAGEPYGKVAKKKRICYRVLVPGYWFEGLKLEEERKKDNFTCIMKKICIFAVHKKAAQAVCRC
jgi:hypothetical protein